MYNIAYATLFMKDVYIYIYISNIRLQYLFYVFYFFLVYHYIFLSSTFNWKLVVTGSQPTYVALFFFFVFHCPNYLARWLAITNTQILVDQYK